MAEIRTNRLFPHAIVDRQSEKRETATMAKSC